MFREVIPEKEIRQPHTQDVLNLLQNHLFSLNRVGGNRNSNSNGYTRETDVDCYMMKFGEKVE